MGSLGKENTLASENPNPLPQLRWRGLDLTHQVAPGVSFHLSVPIDSAWPDRFWPDRFYMLTVVGLWVQEPVSPLSLASEGTSIGW